MPDRRSLTALAVSVLVAGCTAESGPDGGPPEEAPTNVRTLTLAATDLDEFLDLSGALRPLRGTDLASEEAGTVETLSAEKGAVVKRGASLVRLDRDVLAAEMRQAEADRVLAEYNEERTRNLYEANSVSGQDMLLAATQLEKAKAAEAAAKTRHARADIQAPFAGIVTDRYVEVGQYVSPGQRVTRLVDPYTLKLEGFVTEREIASVREGAPAEARFEGVPGTLSATVGWVGFEALPGSGKFPVEIHVDNTDLRLRPGVVGRARVLTHHHEDVIAIPRDAVRQGRNGAIAFVADSGVARERDITLGPDQGLLVIVERGLEAGDRLIVRGHRELVDGAKVLVQEEATGTDGGMGTDPSEVRSRDLFGATP